MRICGSRVRQHLKKRTGRAPGTASTQPSCLLPRQQQTCHVELRRCSSSQAPCSPGEGPTLQPTLDFLLSSGHGWVPQPTPSAQARVAGRPILPGKHSLALSSGGPGQSTYTEARSCRDDTVRISRLLKSRSEGSAPGLPSAFTHIPIPSQTPSRCPRGPRIGNALEAQRPPRATDVPEAPRGHCSPAG